MFPIFGVGLILFEAFHLKSAGVDFTKEMGTNEGAAYDFSPLETSKARFLLKLCFPPGKRLRGGALISILICMNLVFLYMQYAMNSFTGKFWDILVARDWDPFLTMIEFWVFVALNWLIMAVYMSYLQSMVLLEARTSLTAHMQKLWLKGHAYQRVELER